MFDPYEYAEAQGIRLYYQRLRTCHGLWLPEQNAIILKSGMSATIERAVLSHELGHAMLGHTSNGEREEAQADRWAARMLCEPDKIREASKIFENQADIALDCGIPVEWVELIAEVAA